MRVGVFVDLHWPRMKFMISTEGLDGARWELVDYGCGVDYIKSNWRRYGLRCDPLDWC
jgi:hypothetical protein